MTSQTMHDKLSKRPRGLRDGVVGQTVIEVARRAKEWDRHAQDAEAHLAFWLGRGECAETLGAIARASEWARKARETAEF